MLIQVEEVTTEAYFLPLLTVIPKIVDCLSSRSGVHG